MGIEFERAHQISCLNCFEELAVRGVDNDTILLAISNPDVAVGRVHSESMDHAEFSLSDVVAIPLIEKTAVLIKVNHPSSARLVRWIVRVSVVGAFVSVTFADVNVAVRGEGDHQRLP